jgi:hypothetical protein
MHRSVIDLVPRGVPATLMVACVVVAAACASEPMGVDGVDVPPRTTPDALVPVACSTTVDRLCADASCNRTLRAAVQDQSLCEGLSGWVTCGDYTVVTNAGIDSGARFYYKDGDLVAITTYVIPTLHACEAGPTTFNEPRCSSGGTRLPQCLTPGG